MLAIAFIPLLLVAGVVALQVKALLILSEYLPRFPFRPLFRVSAGLIGVIAAHVASIVLFGTIIFLLAKTNPGKFERLEGLETIPFTILSTFPLPLIPPRAMVITSRLVRFA